MIQPGRSGVYRKSPWITGPLRGRFVIAEDVVRQTESALATFRDPAQSHEGMAFWTGIEAPTQTIFLTAVIPHALHGPQRVQCLEPAMQEAVQAARGIGLGILAQIHSHGGDDARHSEGDDQMILMPFEGMLSIVVPHYGRRGMRPLTGCGIHQFQDKRWVLCTSALESIRIVPSCLDLR